MDTFFSLLCTVFLLAFTTTSISQLFWWYCFVTNHPSNSVTSCNKHFLCTQICRPAALVALRWAQLSASALSLVFWACLQAVGWVQASSTVSHYSGSRHYSGHVLMATAETEEAGQTLHAYFRLCVQHGHKYPISQSESCDQAIIKRNVTTFSQRTFTVLGKVWCVILTGAWCEELQNEAPLDKMDFHLFLSWGLFLLL